MVETRRVTLPENVGHEPGEESLGVPSVRRDGSVGPPARGALVSMVLSTPGAVGLEGQSDSTGNDDDAYDDDVR